MDEAPGPLTKEEIDRHNSHFSVGAHAFRDLRWMEPAPGGFRIVNYIGVYELAMDKLDELRTKGRSVEVYNHLTGEPTGE